MSPRAGRTWRRRSPRTTSSSTATRSWLAACARIFIACRSRSAKSIVWRCAAPRLRATAAFFSAPTAPRTRNRRRRPPAAAPASSPPCPRSNSMPKCSKRMAALDQFEAFASLNGPQFYRLPPNAPAHHVAPRSLHRARAHRRGRYRDPPVSRRRNLALAPRLSARRRPRRLAAAASPADIVGRCRGSPIDLFTSCLAAASGFT